MGVPDAPLVLARRRGRVRRGRRGRLVHSRLARRLRRPCRRSARGHAAGARRARGSRGARLPLGVPAAHHPRPSPVRSDLAPAAPPAVGARNRYSICPMAARCDAGVAGARRSGPLRPVGSRLRAGRVDRHRRSQVPRRDGGRHVAGPGRRAAGPGRFPKLGTPELARSRQSSLPRSPRALRSP